MLMFQLYSAFYTLLCVDDFFFTIGVKAATRLAANKREAERSII
jgi:hypothetical protein